MLDQYNSTCVGPVQWELTYKDEKFERLLWRFEHCKPNLFFFFLVEFSQWNTSLSENHNFEGNLCTIFQ